MKQDRKEIQGVDENSVIRGSSNVFADLGLPKPEECLAKAGFALAITETIIDLGLTQSEAAKRMGLDQPKISKIRSGRLREFSTGRLLTCLLHLGLNVEIIVR